MKLKRFASWSIAILFLVSLMACNLPVAQNAGTPDVNGTVAAQVAINLAIQTKVAETLAANGQAVPPAAAPSVAATNTVQVLPQISLTPTMTPTITLTPTPEGVSLVLSNDTYCRLGGPYSSFKIIATVKTGQTVVVLSRNPENDSYYVQNPYDPNTKCWLYGKYATLSGNVQSLPVSTMQPTPTPTYTPTPTSNFTVSYVGLETCAGSYAFKLYVKNAGGIVWKSILITGTDTVTAFAINNSNNSFVDYSGCVAGLSQADLAPGEDSNVLNTIGHFNYDPTGHLINVTVKLCSEDNIAGTCLSKNLSFTP
jgi:hypothetical protein